MLSPGRPVVWGIDLSTKQLDLAFVADDGSWQTNASKLPRSRDDDPSVVLAKAWDQATQFFSVMAVHFPPVYVLVERPTGRFPSPSLMMTAGIVAGALGKCVDAPVDFVAVSSWKAAIGLGGNASKGSVRQWADNLGGSIASQDAADALGVGSAAALRCDGWVGAKWVAPPSYV